MAIGRHRRPPAWSLGWLACALGLAVPGAVLVASAGGAPSGPASYAVEQEPSAAVGTQVSVAHATAAVAPKPEPGDAGRGDAGVTGRGDAGVTRADPAVERLVRVNIAVLVGAAEPVRVRVPRLGIAAGLDPLALGAERELVPPRYGRAGWYQRGPEPGEAGRAVIAGHVDSKSGPDVFYNLRHARRGDRVVVNLADGARIVFTVQRIAAYPKERFPTSRVYGGPRDIAELRLITCGGAYVRSRGGYQENVVVFAVRS